MPKAAAIRGLCVERRNKSSETTKVQSARAYIVEFPRVQIAGKAPKEIDAEIWGSPVKKSLISSSFSY